VAVAASLLTILALAGCATEDSFMAERARTTLIGKSEMDLETCLGLPDKEATRGKTTLLLYSAVSTRTLNLSIPIVNGVGMSFTGSCRATIRLENGRVTQVNYGGDADRLDGPDGVCGQIVRACVGQRS
jgi:hypothetical protein